MTLRLRRGVAVAQVRQGLWQETFAASNLAGGSAGQQFDPYRSQYLAWVVATNTYLEDTFDDRTVSAEFTRNYWQLRAIESHSPRPMEALTVEARRQQKYLERLVERLDAVMQRAMCDGRIAVVDTNVLLHYEPPWQVKWREVVDAQAVRLVIPLRVVEELDEKKYTARDELAARARSLLSELWRRLEQGDGSPTRLDVATTLEVPVEDEARRRTADADAEVLDTCSDLVAAGGDVVLVTSDTGLSLRARACSLTVVAMPDRYRRQKETRPAK